MLKVIGVTASTDFAMSTPMMQPISGLEDGNCKILSHYNMLVGLTAELSRVQEHGSGYVCNNDLQWRTCLQL